MKKFIQNLSITLPQRIGDISILVWLAFAVVPLIFLGLYTCTDITYTTKNGLTIWYMLFDGKPLGEFYITKYPFSHQLDKAYYDFFLYIIFAIWDLPLFIYEKIAGTSFLSSYTAVVYAKSISLFFIVVSTNEVYKITYGMTNDKEKAGRSCFSFVFSTMVFESIFIIGGYDVISLYFTLCGIRAYLKKNDRKFIIWFACAAACKMFSIFIFIPLLLLRYKKVWKVIVGFIGGLSVIVIPKLCFLIYQTASGRQVLEKGIDDTISSVFYIDEYLWSTEAPIATIFLPWFFAASFVLWVLCWFYKKQPSDKQIIYVSLIAMSVFMLTSQTHPQWIILVVPYIAILLGCDSENLSVKLFLEVCMGISHALWKVRVSPQCYSYNIINNMLHFEADNTKFWFMGLPTFMGKLSDISHISIDHIYIAVRSVLVSSFVMLLVYLYPKAEKQEASIEPKEIRRLFYTKAVASMLILLIPLLGVVVRFVIM